MPASPLPDPLPPDGAPRQEAPAEEIHVLSVRERTLTLPGNTRVLITFETTGSGAVTITLPKDARLLVQMVPEPPVQVDALSKTWARILPNLPDPTTCLTAPADVYACSDEHGPFCALSAYAQTGIWCIMRALAEGTQDTLSAMPEVYMGTKGA